MVIFKKPKNELEDRLKGAVKHTSSGIPDSMCVQCPACKKTLFKSDLSESFYVCNHCGYHLRIGSRLRVSMIADENSFSEFVVSQKSTNIIDFPGYNQKLAKAKTDSGENEAVIIGTCSIGRQRCAIFVMDPHFMMGSMGSVVGEKITYIFEYATENKLPVIGYTVSGGARMQEGIISLMQMARISAAVEAHSIAGNFYLTVLTDPTMGGVTASFATLGDVIIAEPKAIIGFAGPRVIEQTIHQKLPENFQRAEFLIEKGFLDSIVERRRQRDFLTKMLRCHQKK